MSLLNQGVLKNNSKILLIYNLHAHDVQSIIPNWRFPNLYTSVWYVYVVIFNDWYFACKVLLITIMKFFKQQKVTCLSHVPEDMSVMQKLVASMIHHTADLFKVCTCMIKGIADSTELSQHSVFLVEKLAVLQDLYIIISPTGKFRWVTVWLQTFHWQIHFSTARQYCTVSVKECSLDFNKVILFYIRT